MKTLLTTLLNIIFLILLVLIVNKQANAEWEGLDTVQVFQNDMRFNDQMDIWNNHVIFNGESSICLMGLNEQNEFTVFDDIRSGHPYGKMQLYENDLYAITNNGLLVAELSGSEINVSGQYTLASITDIAVVNGTSYCLIEGSNLVYSISYDGNTATLDESFDVSVNPIELESDGSILNIKYFENQAFHSKVFSSQNSVLSLEYTTDGYTWPFEAIPYQDRIYVFNTNNYPNIYVNKINPYNDTIEETITFSGYVSSEESTFIRYGDKIVFFWYPPESSEPKVKVLDIPELEWVGEYDLRYSMYPAFPYDDSHLFQVAAGGGAGTTVFDLNIYETTSDTESEFIAAYAPLSFSIYNIFTEGDYTYIANGPTGSLIIKDIASDNYSVFRVYPEGSRNKNIYKCGNYLYIYCELSEYPYNNFLKVYDCTVPEETVLINTTDEIEQGSINNILKLGEFTVVTSNDAYDYTTSVCSPDLETIYSTEDGGLESFVYENYLFKTHNGILKVYEANEQGELELVFPVVDISGNFMHLSGSTLYTRASSTLNVYSLEDPLWPHLMNFAPITCEGYSLSLNSVLGDYIVGASHTRPSRDVILDIVDNEFVIVENFTPQERYNMNVFSDSHYLYATSHGGNLYVMDPRYTAGVMDQPPILLKEYDYNIYPNPANAAPAIKFRLENAGEVGISLYNVLGQKIFRISHVYPSGNHTYTLSDNMKNLASGTYYLGLNVGGQETVKKLTILK